MAAQAIETGEDLELIVRAGAGTENVDMAAASAKGVYVTNCPDKNAAAVAELTFGLLLAVEQLTHTEGIWRSETLFAYQPNVKT